ITTDLDTNLLVEAGAGAGKTTMMVQRLVALVTTGRATIEEVAAVTFTRKAAAELRERFQIALETALREARAANPTAAEVERLDSALRGIDRAFLGTIHSFCARLLRERPLDVGLDPAFREVFGVEEVRLRRGFWERWLDATSAAGDARLDRLAEVGLRPAALYPLFETLAENPDVELPAAASPKPDASALRLELERLMDEAETLMPPTEPEPRWDKLQDRIRELRFHRWIGGWQADADFFDALAGLLSGSRRVVLRRWSGATDRVKAVRDAFDAYAAADGPAARALEAWWAHRYPIAIEFARAAAEAFAQERRRTGRLTFQDLLVLAARLLRDGPAARRALGARYRRLLVDEFQDTDPVQAEVLLLLASAADDDWRQAVPRPGALFVVGDPKQSIFRFRRADIGIYAQVRARFLEFGDVVSLTSNFRSGPPIQALIEAVFAPRADAPHTFPAEATRYQAAYAPLEVQRPDGPAQGLFSYELTTDRTSSREIALDDAERLASWIRRRVDAGERAPGDFLVLTPRKDALAHYGRAFEARGLPVQISGSAVGIEYELHELLRLLRTLADPGDQIGVVATLVGLFFGLDHDRLAAHALDGDRRQSFDFRRPIAKPVSEVERALAELHALWLIATSLPADAALARIVDRLGLLP
ncbi:MAG: UvrD-helicase domain-containing protein, partial [Longimicrobiales bacterium]